MDLIDTLIADWAAERPDLATDAMQVVGRVIRLGRRFQDEVNAQLQPSGLSYSDFDVLATLRRSGAPFALSPKELQQSVVLTSGAMTACLGRLERKGLVSRSGDARDGRKLTAQLTPQGQSLVDSLVIERFALAEREIASLEPAERQRLAELLRALS